MFPIIPLLCLGGIFAGVGGLFWYESLTESQQERADGIAAEYAWDLFEKRIDQLTADQARHVNQLTRRHFN